MTEHPPPAATDCPPTPADPSRAAHTGSAGPGTPDDTAVDLVPGNPPVPITVWRTAEDDHDQHAVVPPRLARRLVAAYSLPGEVVLDVTEGHALTAAALHAGRHHRPAWFTDASALIIGPVTPATAVHDAEAHRHTDPDTVDPDADADPDPASGNPSAHSTHSLGAVEPGWPPAAGWWTGDADVSDVSRADAPGADAEDTTVRTGLVVACWPLTTADAANRTRLGWLLRIASGLLHPGGCLVLLLGAGSGQTVGPAGSGPLVAAAADAGLGYLQHIVAVRADVDGDRFTYYASPTELAALTRHPATHGGGEPGTVGHLRVHSDLIVFFRRGDTDG
jgi:hypothetical protein